METLVYLEFETFLPRKKEGYEGVVSAEGIILNKKAPFPRCVMAVLGLLVLRKQTHIKQLDLPTTLRQ